MTLGRVDGEIHVGEAVQFRGNVGGVLRDEVTLGGNCHVVDIGGGQLLHDVRGDSLEHGREVLAFHCATVSESFSSLFLVGFGQRNWCSW